jgi:HAD superfamily hydrolase (TIGR01549 family)
MVIKLITFDFWNTLFLDRDESVRNSKRISFAHDRLQKFRPSIEPDQINSAFQVASEFFNRQWYELRACTMDLHSRRMLEHLDLEIPENVRTEMVNYFETILLEHPPALVRNAAESVKFASAHCQIGIVSDAGYSPGSTLRKLLEMHEIHDQFASFSFSNETGFLKPSPECFWRVLNELNIKPEEALHIGDLEETDIIGAKRLGMRAIKYIGSNPSSIRESIADAVIDDLSEVESAVRTLQA